MVDRLHTHVQNRTTILTGVAVCKERRGQDRKMVGAIEPMYT
jgi:hypothetical protein